VTPQLKETIKELMNNRGWTGQELARQSKQKTSDIYNILSGKSKKPSADKVEAIARALGVSISTILTGGHPHNPEFVTHNEEWDGLLYNDSMHVVREILARNGIKFFSREEENNKVMRFTMRVYNYARKHNVLSPDPIFAEDIIKHEEI